MNDPILLALETSQREGSVALRQAGGEIVCESLRSEHRHDDDLMPAIDRVCLRAGVGPQDLDAVAVSVGPGGFTGLRIAVTTAKMLGETRAVKLLAVPSALVAAELHEGDGPILVALASKRETFWATTLERKDEAWKVLGEPGIRNAQSMDLSGIAVMLGDRFLPEAVRNRCQREGLKVVEPSFTAEACLRYGIHLLKTGSTTDPLNLAPLYPREPEAVSLWEKRRSSHKP